MQDPIINRSDYSSLVQLANQGLSLSRSKLSGKMQVTLGKGDNAKTVSASALINQTLKNLESTETKAEAVKMYNLLKMVGNPKSGSLVSRVCQKAVGLFSKDVKDDKKAFAKLNKHDDFDIIYKEGPSSERKNKAMKELTDDPRKFLELESDLRNDKRVIEKLLDVTLEADRHDPKYQIGLELLKNKEFALAVVQVKPEYLEDMPEELRDDLDVVFEAVSRDGSCLRYATPRLQDYKAVVLQAVNSNGDALEYASDNLKNDLDVVLQAVKKKGDALKHASDDLKNDVNVVKNALLDKNSQAHPYIGSKLKNKAGKLIDWASKEQKKRSRPPLFPF